MATTVKILALTQSIFYTQQVLDKRQDLTTSEKNALQLQVADWRTQLAEERRKLKGLRPNYL
jgi:hypothetical protein